jgi:hypothetical protein
VHFPVAGYQPSAHACPIENARSLLRSGCPVNEKGCERSNSCIDFWQRSKALRTQSAGLARRR